MTELALNILWLSIAVIATGAWLMSWADARADRSRSRVREFIALACVLVLLFFTVSLTDDLHQDVLLSDESSSVRRHGGSALRGNHHGETKALDSPLLATLCQPPLYP